MATGWTVPLAIVIMIAFVVLVMRQSILASRHRRNAIAYANGTTTRQITERSRPVSRIVRARSSSAPNLSRMPPTPTVPSQSQLDASRSTQALSPEVTTQTRPEWLTTILSPSSSGSRCRARLPDPERGEEEPLPPYSREYQQPSAPEYTLDGSDGTQQQTERGAAEEVPRPPPVYIP